jgi:hypothetical protein
MEVDVQISTILIKSFTLNDVTILCIYDIAYTKIINIKYFFHNKYHKQFMSLCDERIWNLIHELSKERCSGCETDQSSQLEHSCLLDTTQMKLIMLFELAYMKLDIREIFRSMVRDHGCDRTDIIILWKIMQSYCFTDFWKSEIFSRMENEAKSCDSRKHE